MIDSNINTDSSSINAVKAKVEFYIGSTLVLACTCSDYLQEFTVNRTGEENKLFGYGICQELKITLIDLEKNLNINKSQRIKIAYTDGTVTVYPHPIFQIETIERDEDKNTLSITAYDLLYNAVEHTVTEIKDVSVPYTFQGYANAVAHAVKISGARIENQPLNPTFSAFPNYDGSENLRTVLDNLADANQTIYFADSGNNITFKRLKHESDPVLTIYKDDYLTLKVGDNKQLDGLCAATELGDNIIWPEDAAGNIHYIRDNYFFTALDSSVVGEMLISCWDKAGGLAINEFTLKDWVGNMLLEIGDKIAIETEDGSFIYSYVLNDSITFDGTLSQTTQWAYNPSLAETPADSASLGDRLNKTFAIVDKVNKEIRQVVSDTSATNDRLSVMEVTTNEITATVSNIEKDTQESYNELIEKYELLEKEVSTKVDSESFNVTVKEIIKETGAEKVETSTGFVFDKDGLNISKTGSEMTTQITEDGMTVKQNEQEALVANNAGVKAKDLHATTYLRIGSNSRLSDWNGRAACFWVGG